MRILAIRGQNLASLQKQFEIDFTKPPFLGSSLFVVCGETGAGKSTILDALCLALFDNTPRLAQATARGAAVPDVETQALIPSDPRTILRRGAAAGFAEVDFEGSDGAAYRARWEIRRARNSARGRLQKNAEMSLARIDDSKPIGSTRTEVKDHIRRLLGLEFAQFIRAVLLAQNEFATFMRADDNERARLLETLTGTGAFTQISIAAYRRAANEQDKLDALNERLASAQPLEPERRSELDQRLAASRAEVKTLEERQEETKKHLEWYAQFNALQKGVRQAEAGLETNTDAHNAAADRRRALARIDSVQDAKSAIADVDRTRRDTDSCAEEIVKCKAQFHTDHESAETARACLSQAVNALSAAEKARADAGSLLDLAKRLDAGLEALAPQYVAARRSLEAARSTEVEAASALEKKTREHRRAVLDREAALRWIAEHENLRHLAEEWPRWDQILAQANDALTKIRDVEQSLATARDDEGAKKTVAEKADAELVDASEKLANSENALLAKKKALEAFDPESLAENRKASSARETAIRTAAGIWEQLAAARGRVSELKSTIDTQETTLRELREKLALLAQRRPALEAARDQAHRSLTAARLACSENVQQLRVNLSDGAPCPVCGSTEHPYAANAPLDAAIALLETVAKTREGDLTSLISEQAGVANEAQYTDKALSAAVDEFGRTEAELNALESAWAADPVAPETTQLAQPTIAGWFDQVKDEIQKRIDELDDQDRIWRAALVAENVARTEHEELRKSHDILLEKANAAQSAHRDASAKVKAATDSLRAASAHLEELLAQLDPLFQNPEWRNQWLSATDIFRRAQSDNVANWQIQQTAVNDLKQAIAKFEAEIAQLEAGIAAAHSHTAAAQAAYDDLDTRVTQTHSQRQLIFDGRRVVEVEAELDQSIKRAKGDRDRRDGEVRTAADAEQKSLANLESKRKDLLRLEKLASDAASALDSWIAAHNSAHAAESPLDVAELRMLLEPDTAWREQERAALQALDSAVTTSRTVLGERRDQLHAHEDNRPTSATADELVQSLSATVKQLTAESKQMSGLDYELRADDERKRTAASLAIEVERQTTRTKVWASLNDLVGSADGKKFRNFAQRMTLDVLINHSNIHLQRLARRYCLERIPEGLGLLVVDRDMADEKRSVHSLSGGESFLVSLALALGLASLSSNRVKIESLFIDEGFGSLDSRTLATAMDALGRLQLEGRTVGVISHVKEMMDAIPVRVEVKTVPGGASEVVVET